MPSKKEKARDEFRGAPVMTVGKYKGVAADKLPLSYCRWMLTQKFPDDVMSIARKKVEASPLKGKGLSVSAHAIDKFSLLYLDVWLADGKPNGIGIAEYLITMAYAAITLGEKMSVRYDGDSERYRYNGITFCVAGNADLPQYRELITLYPAKGVGEGVVRVDK